MADAPLPAPDDRRHSRWQLIRELAVFSAKAAIEALRDIVLIPVALLAGLAGLLGRRDDPNGPFRDMLRMGRRFDRWLNLFGAIEDETSRTGRQPGETVDQWFDRVEAIVVEQHAKGGVTAGAKRAIDGALDRVGGSRATRIRESTGEEDA